MDYQGQHNTSCPICNKSTKWGHPVIYRIDGDDVGGHLWCTGCFEQVYHRFVRINEEGIAEFESFLQTIVSQTGWKLPGGAMPSGFCFYYFTGDHLGLAINYGKQKYRRKGS